jgi:hypothetical protein
MSRSHIQAVVVCVALFTGLPDIRAVEFAGGTGRDDDPYQIATAGQIFAI